MSGDLEIAYVWPDSKSAGLFASFWRRFFGDGKEEEIGIIFIVPPGLWRTSYFVLVPYYVLVRYRDGLAAINRIKDTSTISLCGWCQF